MKIEVTKDYFIWMYCKENELKKLLREIKRCQLY